MLRRRSESAEQNLGPWDHLSRLLPLDCILGKGAFRAPRPWSGFFDLRKSSATFCNLSSVIYHHLSINDRFLFSFGSKWSNQEDFDRFRTSKRQTSEKEPEDHLMLWSLLATDTRSSAMSCNVSIPFACHMGMGQNHAALVNIKIIANGCSSPNKHHRWVLAVTLDLHKIE